MKIKINCLALTFFISMLLILIFGCKMPADLKTDSPSYKLNAFDPVDAALPVKMEDIGNYYIVFEDMLLDKRDENQQKIIEEIEQYNQSLKTGKDIQSKGVSTFDIKFWPDGIIPYSVAGSFSEWELRNIEIAIDDFESICGVAFVKTDPGEYVYNVDKMYGNVGISYSTVGYTKHAHCRLSYAGLGTIMHEFMHGLGFQHEHQRSDRDTYIKIHWDNIDDDWEYAFKKFTIGGFPADIHLSAYDYSSIMHYEEYAFSLESGMITIEALNGAKVGGNDYLSAGDIQSLRAVYGAGKSLHKLHITYYSSDIPSRIKTSIIPDLCYNNEVPLSTPETIESSVGPNHTRKLNFSHWDIRGAAFVENPSENTASVKRIRGETYITAIYNEVEDGPYYQMTVSYFDDDGNKKETYYNDLTESDLINIETPLFITVGNPAQDKKFLRWDIAGAAACRYPENNNTNIGSFSSDVKVSAIYENYNETDPDLRYSLTVLYSAGGGDEVQQVYPSLSPDDTQVIYAPETIETGDSRNPVTLSFLYWDYTGTASIDDLTDNSTTVGNFGSDVSITAYYGTGAINLEKPVLSSPSNNSVITEQYPIFQWLGIRDAHSYALMVSEKPNITNANSIIKVWDIVDSYYISDKRLEPGKTYYWRVRYKKNNSVSYWSDTGSFSVLNTMEKYTVNYRYVNTAGNIIESTKQLIHDDILYLHTEEQYTDPETNKNYLFIKWKSEGNAQYDDRWAYTTIENISSDFSIWPEYKEESTLIVEYYNERGERLTETHTPLNPDSIVPISTPQKYVITDNNYYEIELWFNRWKYSGEVSIDNNYSSSTTVRNIQTNAVIKAEYADTPPPPLYTVRVDSKDSYGNSETEYFRNLGPDDEIRIYTYSAYSNGKMVFDRWDIIGSAKISDRYFVWPKVWEISSDVHIIARYKQAENRKYQVVAAARNEDGTVNSRIFSNLAEDSVVTVSTPLYILGGKKIFDYWDKVGFAAFGNLHSAETTVRNFESDVEMTAIYKNAPVWTVVMNYRDEYGNHQSKSFQDVTMFDNIALSTISSYEQGDPAHQQVYVTEFLRWNISGTGTITSINSSAATLKNVSSNVTVSAVYHSYKK